MDDLYSIMDDTATTWDFTEQLGILMANLFFT